MKNEYKVTRELMMSWAKEYHLRGGKNILMFILWCMVGLCGLVSGILFIINGGDPLDIIISAFMFFFTVYKLAFSRFVAWSDRYKLLANTYDAKEWLRTTEFLEDEIIIAEHTTTMKCFYSEIDTVKEKGNAVLIFFKNNTAIRLYKDAFTDGSWDECKKKIISKMSE